MRQFIAIRPTPGFQTGLTELQERLRAAGVTGKYRDPDGLHLTLAFIGEWPEKIIEALPVIRKPFSLTLAHPGVFPKANVLWAGVEPSEELDCLANQVRSNLEKQGIPFDRKPFNPHITLARKPFVPERVNLPEIQVPQVSMTVEDICLYRADRGMNGMVYTVIGSGRENGTGCGLRE